MTPRTLPSLGLCLSLGLVAAASCGKEDKPAPFTQTTTSSTTTTSSSGSGGGGGTGGTAVGGSGGGGGVAPGCQNVVKDGSETDVDCGGGDCAACADGKVCVGNADCVSQRCDAGTCAVATCSNGVKDGDETDVDCGGGDAPSGNNPACLPCPDLDACLDGVDCQSQSCVNDVCLPPTCLDGVANGDETDLDCGGPLCVACTPGMTCAVPADCDSGVCLATICLPPACNDGLKNGLETDIDCGGSCSGKCPAGQKCAANADCATGICNSQTKLCACPTGMVIAAIAGGGSYCIDAYEVTNDEYVVFVNANPQLPNLPAACTANTVFVPSGTWPPPAGTGKFPVVRMDWCDAFTYCAYAGRHLCGKVGGGTNAFGAYADPAMSEWFNACTAQGTNDYPYGDVYGAGMCNDSAPLDPEPTPPALPPACQGGVPGLYHMSGNAAEWEDSCDALGQCRVRGGSVTSDQTGLRCDADGHLDRLDDTNGEVGFRCCL
ncbi:MAG: SUMF1/EgtB/PvdO family nonheme iron enzyme [Polyangiaceae bacterium]|nr:SUMF1/EgtB/PvdO family nonheme iron enzyme [Polyangiaceae bacterium]